MSFGSPHRDNQTDWEWHTDDDEFAPCARYGHTAVAIGSKVYFLGGTDDKTFFDDIHIYELDTGRWTRPVPKEKPPHRAFHTATHWKDGLILVFGGMKSMIHPHQTTNLAPNVLHMFDTRTLRFRDWPTTGNPPSPRYHHTANIYNDRLYIFGGTESGNAPVDDFLCVLDLGTMTWLPLPEIDSEFVIERYLHSAAVHNGKLYVSQGISLNGSEQMFIGEINLDTYEVTESNCSDPVPRIGHAIFVLGDFLITAGGKYGPELDYYSNATASDSLTLWDLNTGDSFSGNEQPQLDALQRDCFASVVVDDHLFMFGGRKGTEARSETLSFDFQRIIRLRVPKSKAVEELGSILNEPEYADLTVVSQDGKSIAAHKAIVFARCPHLNNVFAAGMKEAQDNTIHMAESHEIVRAFLHYLYTDALDPTPDVVMGLMLLADMYLIDRLKALCARFLYDHISIDNCIRVFRTAAKSSHNVLKHAAVTFIADNLYRVFPTAGLKELSPHELEELQSELPPMDKIFGLRRIRERPAPPVPDPVDC